MRRSPCGLYRAVRRASAIRRKLLEPLPLVRGRRKCTGCGECLDYCPVPEALVQYAARLRDVEVGHMQQEEPSLVVFRVRFGRKQFTCKGHLVREGGIVYAVVDEMPDDCPFPPDQVKLEESDLELKHDEDGGAYYEHHGFIFVY
jgi:ferredoxin